MRYRDVDEQEITYQSPTTYMPLRPSENDFKYKDENYKSVDIETKKAPLRVLLVSQSWKI